MPGAFELGSYKPGSVPVPYRPKDCAHGDDHLSGRIVTDRLKRPTRISNRHEPRPVLADGFLLGLAPDEVYLATLVTKRAVSSYLAVSPLPALLQAVCFLLHCLSHSCAWTLSSILLCGARTFLQLSPAAIRYPCPQI